MHQYLLGTEKNEKKDEHVVSKVFHQPQKRTKNNDDIPIIEVAKTDKNTVHDDILIGGHAIILHASISEGFRIQWLSLTTPHYLFTSFLKMQVNECFWTTKLNGICFRTLTFTTPSFGDLNYPISTTMHGATCGLSSPGQLNLGLCELATNLIHFLRPHFLWLGLHLSHPVGPSSTMLL